MGNGSARPPIVFIASPARFQRQSRCCPRINGQGGLVHQGLVSSKRWGIDPPKGFMYKYPLVH